MSIKVLAGYYLILALLIILGSVISSDSRQTVSKADFDSLYASFQSLKNANERDEKAAESAIETAKKCIAILNGDTH